MAAVENLAENTFIGHLLELRTRLIRALLAVFVGFLLSYPFSKEIYNFLAAPLIRVLPPDSHLIYTSLPEVFLTYVKLSLLSGFILALPVVLYQFWAFVAPGLYEHERKAFFPTLFASVFLFVAGMAFAYFVVFPAAFRFFVSFSNGDISAMPQVSNYLSLVVKFSLAFGLAFQIPIIIVVLTRIGIIQVDTLRRGRRYAFLICAIAAAILSPPDVLSMILLMVPMYLLFEVGLFFAARMPKREEPAAAPAVTDPDGEMDTAIREFEGLDGKDAEPGP